MQLRLSGTQLDEKREAEGAVKDIEEQLELEADEGKRAELAAELAARQGKLDELMDKFAVRGSIGLAGWLAGWLV